MNIYILSFLFVFLVKIQLNIAAICGCKTTRRCYHKMVKILRDRDEEPCVEDAAMGVSTLMIYLKALKQFCPDIINVQAESLTYEGRHLYEVVLNAPKSGMSEDTKPVIVIEAGQQGGQAPLEMALYIIEQLLACQENSEMIEKVRWVIMPCSNPDGLEYARFNRDSWKKNLRASDDGLSYGVDITRNFDNQWGSCEKCDNGFSPIFPGIAPASENETIFIKNVLNKHKKELKVYLSIRRDGHALLYPYAYTKNAAPNSQALYRLCGDITSRVNQRAGTVQLFSNDSIFNANGKVHCGHSVDYAYDQGVPFTYEMRVFPETDKSIMSKFQPLPKGYESSLRIGYFAGIRELYNAVTHHRRYGRMFK